MYLVIQNLKTNMARFADFKNRLHFIHLGSILENNFEYGESVKKCLSSGFQFNFHGDIMLATV